MSTRQEIDQDLAFYFSKEEELKLSDRREMLRALFQKHFLISNEALRLGKFEFDQIISGASNTYSKMAMPVKISNKLLSSSEVSNFCVIESAISMFNNKDAFKRKPEFDR